MKKMLVLLLVLVFVISGITMANVNNGNQEVNVTVEVEPYATLDLIGDILLNSDPSESSNTSASVDFGFQTNTTLDLSVSSSGFNNADNEESTRVNQAVDYNLYLSTYSVENPIFKFNPGNQNKTHNFPYDVDHSIGNMTFEVLYNIGRDWNEVEAGEYTDTITFTVSAAV
ncbi:MAG: hypothetical protein ACOCRO_08750 [Halanaerobiales bacterium]